jgi:hypothetical protein
MTYYLLIFITTREKRRGWIGQGWLSARLKLEAPNKQLIFLNIGFLDRVRLETFRIVDLFSNFFREAKVVCQTSYGSFNQSATTDICQSA